MGLAASSNRLKMPKEQRAGLLTHPAWLTAYSLNEGNDPIHRGIWVYETVAGRGTRRRAAGRRCCRANRSSQDTQGTDGAVAKPNGAGSVTAR